MMGSEPLDFSRLKEHGKPTARQIEYLDAIVEHGSTRKAAAALGVHNATIDGAVRAVRERAARAGHAPGHFDSGVAPGYLMGKVTVQRSAAGVERTWERMSPDRDRAMAAIREWIEDLAREVRPEPLIAPPEVTDEDLLCIIPMGDPHFGMYAWKDEAGEDFDLSIAERITTAAVDNLISRAPNAKTGILLNLGDMFHADTNSATTTKGTPQDVDSRWQKVMQVGLRTMTHCVMQMKAKFHDVIVRVDPGNHDKHAAFALAMALDCMFRGDPRVSVDLSPAEHWYFKFGKVMIGSTHGDGAKPEALPGIMFTDQRKNLADVEYCYWYCGHIHTSKVYEGSGCLVEYFRTLAPGNAWSTGAGYRAGRDMRCIVIHREYGEWDRAISPIRLIERVA